MKLSILSAAVLSASVLAAPLAAEEIKPIEPKASTQGAPLILGGLTTQIPIIVVAATGFVAIAASVDSSSKTPTK